MTVKLHIAIFSFSVINNNFQCQTSGWLWAWRWCKYMKNKIYHSWVLKIDCDQVKNILSDFSHLYNMATSKSQWGHKSLWKSLHHATFVTTGNCFPLLLFLSLQRLTEFFAECHCHKFKSGKTSPTNVTDCSTVMLKHVFFKYTLIVVIFFNILLLISRTRKDILKYEPTQQCT